MEDDDAGNKEEPFRLLDSEAVGGQELSLGLLNDLILLCPDAIIGADKGGRVIIFNQAAERLTGFCFEQVIDKKNVACFYGSVEKARLIKREIYNDGNGGKGRLEGYECEIVNHQGRKIPIRLSAALLYRNSQEVGKSNLSECGTSFTAERRRLQIQDMQQVVDCFSPAGLIPAGQDFFLLAFVISSRSASTGHPVRAMALPWQCELRGQ